MANKFVPDADAFRFYNTFGDIDLDSSPGNAAENTNLLFDPVSNGAAFTLRYRVQEVGGGSVDGEDTDSYALQFQVEGGGSWTDVSTQGITPLCYVLTDPGAWPGFTNGDPTTNRSTDGISDGTGSFIAGKIVHVNGITFKHTADNFTEHCFVLLCSNNEWTSTGTDFIELRMRYNGGSMTNSVTPRLTQTTFRPDPEVFRFYEDGTESGSTPIENEDVDLVDFDMIPGDAQIHLRLGIDALGTTSGTSSDDYHLFARLNGAENDYLPVTTTSSFVKADSASSLSGGSDSTDRSTDGITDGIGSFVAGEQSVTGVVTDRQLTTGNFTEHVWALVLIADDLSDGDSLTFQLRAPTDGPFDARPWGLVPNIFISKGAIRDLIMGPGIIPFAR